MNLLFPKLIILSVLLGASGLVQATPLQRTDVPADPMWLVHIDFDNLRPTTVGQYIVDEMDKPEAQAKLSAFQALFKFDLRTQLHGLTLYGMPESSDKGVLLVYADFDPEHMAMLAKAATEYQSTNHNDHVIHSWIDQSRREKHGEKPRTYAAAQGSRVLIFGQNEAAVAKALDVLDLSAPSLSASRSFPALDNGSAFFEAAMQNLKTRKSDPSSEVFRLSKSGRIQISENQKQVSATLQLSASDEEIAKHIATIGQGLIALMKLQRDHPEATKFADALSLKQDTNNVIVTFSLPASDTVELMKADAARKAKKSE